jgi:hypothetical protein
MSRVEKYKQQRNLRHKYMLSILLFFSLLTAGICTADYSINSLLGDESRVNVIELKNNGTYLEFAVMNQKLYINTKYINRDLDKLKQGVSKLFGR